MIPKNQEIKTNEQFLQSRRDKNFEGDYSPEELAWYNTQSRLHAITLSSAFQSERRQGFPKMEALERAVDNWRAYERYPTY